MMPRREGSFAPTSSTLSSAPVPHSTGAWHSVGYAYAYGYNSAGYSSGGGFSSSGGYGYDSSSGYGAGNSSSGSYSSAGLGYRSSGSLTSAGDAAAAAEAGAAAAAASGGRGGPGVMPHSRRWQQPNQQQDGGHRLPSSSSSSTPISSMTDLHHLAARQLTGLISAAGSLEKLLDLLQWLRRAGAALDHMHAAAAFVRTRQLLQLDPRARQQPVTQQLVQHLQHELLTPELVVQCDARALANILNASAHIGGMSVVGELLPAFVGNLAGANPQDIANTLWALATMGPPHMQHVPPEHVQQLVAALVSKLQQANPQDIANTLWALATMGPPHMLHVPPKHVQQLVAALVSKLRQAQPQAIANTLWACAHLRFMPTELLAALDRQPQLLLQQLMAGMTTQDLSNSAWACGVLGHSSTRLPGVFLRQAVSRLLEQGQHASFATKQLSNLCWSAAVLDLQQHTADVLLLAQACCARWQDSGLAAADMCQLYQVHLWLCDRQLAAGHDGRGGLLGCLTVQQLQQCRRIWEQDLAQKTAASAASGLQRSVFAALQQLPAGTWQQAPVMEQRTADGAYSIDIAATTADGVAVAIEVDGPTHFLQPGRALDGPTQCRNRALAARGYAVLSVPYWDWDELKTGEQQRAWLVRHVYAAADAGCTKATAAAGAAAAGAPAAAGSAAAAAAAAAAAGQRHVVHRVLAPPSMMPPQPVVAPPCTAYRPIAPACMHAQHWGWQLPPL